MKCELKKGELIKIDLSRGENLLQCLSGALWITTGNGVDYLLSSCGSTGALTGKEALVEALEDSSIQLVLTTSSVPCFRQISSGRLRVMAGA